MREWVPRWWRGEAGWQGRAASLLLWPAEQLFRGGVAARNRAYDAGILKSERAPIPVISIGNVGVGGAGKTPVSAFIAGRLEEWGRRPAIVLRGYGADEILVHRELNPEVPVFAAAVRIDAVREAAKAGRDVAVLDDAFQHRAIARDLDIVLVPADGWVGRFRLLPRGPWRESLVGLRRADLVAVTRKAVAESAAVEVAAEVGAWAGRDRVVRCRLGPGDLVGIGAAAGERRSIEMLEGRRVVAVTSLADPAPFVAQLEACGAGVTSIPFPDHHLFTAEEAIDLAARAAGRPLVMTRKEAVKLRPLLPAGIQGWMMEQEVRIEAGGELLDAALRRALSG